MPLRLGPASMWLDAVLAKLGAAYEWVWQMVCR